MFGEMAAITGEPRGATMMALEPTVVVRISKAMMRQKIQACDPFVKALILHLEFVTIHPFFDGNGRLGRLLMNLLLLANKGPWLTIPAEQRIPFFQAIERAQVDGDIAPYLAFTWDAVRQAATPPPIGSTTNRRRSR